RPLFALIRMTRWRDKTLKRLCGQSLLKRRTDSRKENAKCQQPAMNSSYRQLRLASLSGLLLLWLASQLQPGAAQSLLPNGSFEEGEPPTGWRAHPGGTVAKGDAHRGERRVSGASSRRSVVWESDSAAISPQTDHRLEGWIRCPKGEGQLDVELTDVRGKVLSRFSTPVVRRAADWRYAAVEWNSTQGALDHVVFRVQGKADLDDVVLAPVAASFIGNKSVDGDDRGRIPLWNEEQNNELLPGRRAGKLALDS